ncbi:MAG: RDD family protein [Actinomycetota bacterium]|nr:RDD family protein [Actinomycetota bacterium]
MAADAIVKPTSLAGHYAGVASRTGAYVVDGFVSVAVYTVGVAGVRFLLDLVLDVKPPDKGSPIWLVGFVVWQFVYLAGCWGTSGKTPGNAMLGIRVVRGNGHELGLRRAIVRTIVYPFSFLFCGVGLIGVVIGKHRRALHDVAAGSVVVYDWDARAARLRFLARRTDAQTPGG